MSKAAVVSVEIDAETLALIDKVAAARELDRNELLTRMIRKQVRTEAEFIDFLQAGIDDLDAGRAITHEELIARLKAGRQARKAA